MKLLAAAVPSVAAIAFVIGVRASNPWFAPRAEDFVTYASSSITANPGQPVVIGTVPRNKKLVVTDVNVQQSGGSASISGVQLEERDASGSVTVKVPEYVLSNLFVYPTFSHSDGHGIVFQSGSDVAFTNTPLAGGPVIFAYLVNGYLTE